MRLIIKEWQFCSFFLIKKSANLGNPYAQYNLGLLFYKGIGCKKSQTKAIAWIKKSALQGYPDAQYWLNERS